MTTTTMDRRTMALAAALLLTSTTTTATNEPNGVPPSRVIRNEDLFDIMLSQSSLKDDHDDESSSSSHHHYHRHLSSIPTDEKSSIIRNNWLSISPDTQFLPNVVSSILNHHQPQNQHRNLGGYSATNPYYTEPFVDGMAEYDEDSQSWRKLGFIIDCNANDEEYYSEQSQHSGDNNVQVTETGCARYLIWAAVSI